MSARSLYWQNRTNWSFQSEISHITAKRRKLSVCHWTPASKVHLDKLIVVQLIAQFLDFYGAYKFMFVFKNSFAGWCPEQNWSSSLACILYIKVQIQHQNSCYSINEQFFEVPSSFRISQPKLPIISSIPYPYLIPLEYSVKSIIMAPRVMQLYHFLSYFSLLFPNFSSYSIINKVKLELNIFK